MTPAWTRPLGVRVLRFDGAFAPRVLKFDTAFQAVRVEVGGCAASMNKTFTTGLRPGKTSKPPLRAMEKRSPFGAVRHQRGESRRRRLIHRYA